MNIQVLSLIAIKDKFPTTLKFPQCSTLDDPMLLSAMLPWRFFITEHLHKNVRWSLCAREICYSNPLLGQFFQSGKTLPIERGQGVGQPIMHVVASEVGKGAWVHVFPEGRINYNGRIGQLRWGIGKLFCDAVNANAHAVPMVLPFYHSGMGRVLPKGGRLPRAGKHVSIYVGDEIPMEDLAQRCRNAQNVEDQKCVWQDVVARIADALRSLEARGPANPDQTHYRTRKVLRGGLEGALPVGDEA